MSEEYLDAVLETLYEAFKSGGSVTLKSFRNFYLDPRRSGCVFKFNPSQKLKALFGWSSTYKGPFQHAKERLAYQACGADGVQIAVYRKGLASLVWIQAAAHRQRYSETYMVPDPCIWVFVADGTSFPSGLFHEKENAIDWIKKNKLTGTLSAMPVDSGVFDWALRNNALSLKAEKIQDKLQDPIFIGSCLPASLDHFHFFDGAEKQ